MMVVVCRPLPVRLIDADLEALDVLGHVSGDRSDHPGAAAFAFQGDVCERGGSDGATKQRKSEESSRFHVRIAPVEAGGAGEGGFNCSATGGPASHFTPQYARRTRRTAELERTLPIGIACAVWTGIGPAGTAVAWGLFGEAASAVRIAGVGLIVLGVALLRSAA